MSCWDWGVIGTWFSGAGSIFVGVVALYLAHAPERVRLELVSPQPFRDPDQWHFTIRNRGKRPVTLVEVDWWIGSTKTSFPAQLFQATKLPSVSMPGASMWFAITLPKMAMPREDVPSMRLVVHTASGIHREFRLDPRMMEALQALQCDPVDFPGP